MVPTSSPPSSQGVDPSDSNQMLNAGVPSVATTECYIVQEWNLENFLQHHSARFDGKCSSNEADQWFRDIERICSAKKCPDEKELAYTEYLPYSVRYDLEIEFFQLIPGNMS
ncbi:hypothetical protein LR48_Vigan03g015500 [Vigna angularis]|uniref:Retrotransposon gag domain-containing protein n=1 Tax=Phaseolus angularis TaxID=3914 RepID=A0A0L9U2Z2_PHAAN|nr:hypothetical protein LR48_Vigan03g015500 [Vigna angularis]